MVKMGFKYQMYKHLQANQPAIYAEVKQIA